MKEMLIAVAAFAALCAGGGAFAQSAGNLSDQEQLLIAKLQTNKRAVVIPAMGLTDAEVGAFTPIYDQYEADMKKQLTKATDLVNRYASSYDTMTDSAAKDLMKEAFKLLRFVQIESKLSALQDWQVAQIIPLVK